MLDAVRAVPAIGLGKDDKYGPLPWLLLVLTMVTGVMDAVSYLKLGGIFVANMTGNVVYSGFAISHVRDFSIPAPFVAIASFFWERSRVEESGYVSGNIAAGIWRGPRSSNVRSSPSHW
jgi:hypothetical protein